MAVCTVRETVFELVVGDDGHRQRDSLHRQRAGRRLRGAPGRLLEVVATSRRLERRHARALSPHERHQLAPEPLSGDAVQEEVDGVVETGELMADRSTSEVGRLRGSAGELPAVSTHRQHYARRDADDERHGRRDAHERRLSEDGSS